MTPLKQVSGCGRARRLANRYWYGVEQQLVRLRQFDRGQEYAHMQLKNDWEMVIILLSRLRRCLAFVSKFPAFKGIGELELAKFDNLVPHLKQLRDFEEHFDDYSLGRGQNKQIGWGALETYSFGVSQFSNGAGEITATSISNAALLVWTTFETLEEEAIKLGYLTWEERHGEKVASGN